MRHGHSPKGRHRPQQPPEVGARPPAPTDHVETDHVENARKNDRLHSPKAEKERRATSKTDIDQAAFAPNAASRVPPRPNRGDNANASRLYPGTVGGDFAQPLKNFAAAPEAPEKPLSARSSPPAASSETVRVTAAAPAIRGEQASVNDQAQSELFDKAQL